ASGGGVVVCVVFFFFFSSRRRHTRLVSDWSSDVCSSDLRGLADGLPPPAHRALAAGGPGSAVPERPRDRRRVPGRAGGAPPRPRSEERRVGKEGRCRGGTEQLKKKKATGGGERRVDAEEE